MQRIGDQGQTPVPKEIVDGWEKEMTDYYHKMLNDRPKDWYLTAPALGPYKIEPDAK